MPALLAIWHDVDPAVSADYMAWYDGEHFPERLGVPGFRNGQRFEALDDATKPARLAFYEVESLAVLASGEYRRCLEHPTPRTTRVISGFRNSIRGACKVVLDGGSGHGTFCATIALRPDTPVDVLAKIFASIRARPNIVRVRVIEGDESATGPMTAEQRLRGAPDAPVGRVAIIEADDAAALASLEAFDTLALEAPKQYQRLRYADAAQYQR
jgi:hypothetical protein